METPGDDAHPAWITAYSPDIYYIYWVRDPRDSIVGAHITDDSPTSACPTSAPMTWRRRRAISWRYQYDIMQATPPPRAESTCASRGSC